MTYDEFLARIDEFVGYIVQFEAVWTRDGSRAGTFERYVWDNKQFGPPAKDALMKVTNVRIIRKAEQKKIWNIHFI